MKKPVRLKDIAEEAGVGLMAVSAALRDKPGYVGPEKRAMIKEIAKRMGYVPNVGAWGLRARRGRAVAIVVTSIAGQSKTIEAITKKVFRLGYDVLLIDPNPEIDWVMRMVAAGCVAAVSEQEIDQEEVGFKVFEFDEAEKGELIEYLKKLQDEPLPKAH